MEPTGIVEWKKEYESGIKDIDRQHKYIFKTLNEIYFAVEGKAAENQLHKIIETFDSYINIHFSTEENYAEKYNFPKTEELKKSHAFFKTIYQPLRDYYYYNAQHIGTQKILHLHSVMKGWLEHHVNGIDRELCIFLKKKL